MSDGRSHSTLREWRAHLIQPLALVIFVGVATILTLIAPFRSGQLDHGLLRFAYWLVIAFVTYAIGALAHRQAGLWFAGQSQRLTRIAVAALITALGANITVIAVDAIMLARLPAVAELPGFVANTSAIAIIIAVIFHLLPDTPDTKSTAAQPPALLDRLPFDKRGPLVALSVEDHYVRVRTRSGEEVVLMRLSDAIRETSGTKGLQVHRSHWVAVDQVTAVHRKGDGARLCMTTGPDIPVSRAHIPAIREAGLLPR